MLVYKQLDQSTHPAENSLIWITLAKHFFASEGPRQMAIQTEEKKYSKNIK